MSLRINQNTDALNSYRNLSVTQGQLSKSLEKLSSGFRINRAADDAAGLAISEGLRSQVGGLKVGVRNAQDGISVAQTAEGALTEVHSMLQRMNDLSVQYNNGTQNTDSQAALQAEFDALQSEVTRIATNTKFNGVDLFAGNDMKFQVGYDVNDTITIDGATALKAVDTSAAVITDSSTVQTAITAISNQRAALGAIQNRFDRDCLGSPKGPWWTTSDVRWRMPGKAFAFGRASSGARLQAISCAIIEESKKLSSV
jgi:flagellin